LALGVLDDLADAPFGEIEMTGKRVIVDAVERRHDGRIAFGGGLGAGEVVHLLAEFLGDLPGNGRASEFGDACE
jgi:hypothetical protein